MDGTLASTTNNLAGLNIKPNVTPGGTSTNLFIGVNFLPVTNSTNLSGGALAGLYGGSYVYGSGTVGTAYGGYFQNQAQNTATISTSYNVYIDNPAKTGTISTNYGLYIVGQTNGSNNAGVVIGGLSTNVGHYHFSYKNTCLFLDEK